MKGKNNDLYYTYSQIKKMGFSSSLIKKLLSEPILIQNPTYKTASPIKLYSKSEVNRAMDNEVFKNYQTKRTKVVARALESVKKRKKENITRINDEISKIKVKKINIEILEDITISDKNDWCLYNGKDNYIIAKNEVDSKTLKRWMINYVRHNLTDYDETLFTMKGKVGVREMYNIYKNAVMKKIKEVYPTLFDDD